MSHYAQKVCSAKTVDEARTYMLEMIEAFDHKEKAKQFKETCEKIRDIKKLQRFAWDIVLRGDNLQVLK